MKKTKFDAKKYIQHDDELCDVLNSAYQYLAENSKPLPKEFAQIINENFDELIGNNSTNNERERNI